MSELQTRLEQLKTLIQQDDFLSGKGLSNEVNIRIFCYKPAEEMIIRHFTQQLVRDMSLGCNIVEFNLYEVFLSICEDMSILDRISDMEESKGKEFLLTQLSRIADNKSFVSKMDYEPKGPRDVVVITGVGQVYPFLRVHDLLNAIQPVFSDVPILVFYPGTYDGHDVQLFNCLTKNSYYRAFNVL